MNGPVQNSITAVFKIRSEHHYDRDIAQVSGDFCKWAEISANFNLLVWTLSKKYFKNCTVNV